MDCAGDHSGGSSGLGIGSGCGHSARGAPFAIGPGAALQRWLSAERQEGAAFGKAAGLATTEARPGFADASGSVSHQDRLQDGAVVARGRDEAAEACAAQRRRVAGPAGGYRNASGLRGSIWLASLKLHALPVCGVTLAVDSDGFGAGSAPPHMSDQDGDDQSRAAKWSAFLTVRGPMACGLGRILSDGRATLLLACRNPLLWRRSRPSSGRPGGYRWSDSGVEEVGRDRSQGRAVRWPGGGRPGSGQASHYLMWRCPTLCTWRLG